MQRIHPGSSTTGRSAVSDTGIDAMTASDTSAPAMTSLEARTTTAARWRQILPAALCAAAVSAVWLVPAIASAEPNSGEWDIGAFDDCVKSHKDPDGDISNGDYENCCVKSGGNMKYDGDNVSGTCVAPPYQEVRPGLTPLPGLTLTPVPATPSPGVVPTLTVVPGNRR